jgi:hypothetical protein
MNTSRDGLDPFGLDTGTRVIRNKPAPFKNPLDPRVTMISARLQLQYGGQPPFCFLHNTPILCPNAMRHFGFCGRNEFYRQCETILCFLQQTTKNVNGFPSGTRLALFPLENRMIISVIFPVF